jgi:hypothetical protein
LSIGRSLSARTGYYLAVGRWFDNFEQIFAIGCGLNAEDTGEKRHLCCRTVFNGGFV